VVDHQVSRCYVHCVSHVLSFLRGVMCETTGPGLHHEVRLDVLKRDFGFRLGVGSGQHLLAFVVPIREGVQPPLGASDGSQLEKAGERHLELTGLN
jgi:hypothetical protein